MYTQKEYWYLKEKYGQYSSWAIWNEENANDTCVIDDNYEQLKPNYVFLGLNISKPLKNFKWSNFHGGKHDRKLVHACNRTGLRGSYLIDIFKNIPEPKSFQVKKYIERNPEIIKINVDHFNREMGDIKIHKNTVFIILGTESSLVSKYFKKYFLDKYQNRVLNYYHYSYCGITDKKWIKGLWKLIETEH